MPNLPLRGLTFFNNVSKTKDFIPALKIPAAVKNMNSVLKFDKGKEDLLIESLCALVANYKIDKEYCCAIIDHTPEIGIQVKWFVQPIAPKKASIADIAAKLKVSESLLIAAKHIWTIAALTPEEACIALGTDLGTLIKMSEYFNAN